MLDIEPHSKLHTALWILIAIAIIPAVPVLIIVLAMIEFQLFGTEHIGRIVEMTGTLDFFRWLLNFLFEL